MKLKTYVTYLVKQYFSHLFSYVLYVPMWLNCIFTLMCYADCDPVNVVFI